MYTGYKVVIKKKQDKENSLIHVNSVTILDLSFKNYDYIIFFSKIYNIIYKQAHTK